MNENKPTTEKESPPAFEGFIQPKKNYFHMPNMWIDICAEIDNLAELKITQYVLRHTWGYQEYGIPKAITIDEFMHGRKRTDGTRMDKGTGLSKQSVVDGVKRSVKHEYLVCVIDDTDKARVTKSYALKMRSEGVKDLDTMPDVKDLDIENGCQETRHQMSRTLTLDVKETDISGLNSRQRSEKDTLEKHLEKNTEERQESVSATVTPSDDSATSPDDRDAHALSQVESETKKSAVNAQTAAVPASKPATATAQLSTLTASSPQQSAKVAPRPSVFVSAPLFGTQKPARPQLTEEGKNVLEWYQIIRAAKVRKTDANINACNGLGEEDGMSFENLKKAIEHWEAHSYVKERQIPIDLQKLEDPKGAFTFAKAMLVIRAKPTGGRKPVLLSCANMTDEEYNAYIRR